jgi:TusA-related sulfurtransferase
MKHRNQYDPEAKTVRKFISGYDDPEHRREGRIIGGKNPNEVLSVEPRVVVDLRGLRCPLPAKRVAEEIEHAEAGKLLELLTDSEGSAYDEIPAELDVLTSSFVVLEQWQGLWKVKVRK